MPVIPPNNTTGLYGTSTTVTINDNVYANNLVLTGSADVAGNVTAQYFIGNGSQLTGLAETYSNAEVATFLANFGSNTISTTGNITGGNISGTHLGSGAGLANITGANVTGAVPAATVAATVTANAQPNITSTGVLTSVSTTGNVTAGNVVVNQDVSVTGSVTAGTYYGTFAGNISGNIVAPGSNTWVLYNNNGSVAGDSDFRFNQADSSVTVTGNVQAGNVSTNSLTATGTVSAATLVGSGAQISNITGANVSGTVANAAFATTAATAGTVTTAAQPNITSVGLLNGLTMNTGNITGNLATTHISGASLSVFGNVTGTHFGSGAGLSSLTGANVTGTVANAAFATTAGSAGSATTAVTAGTVTTNAQPNITSLGTLTSLSVTGNVLAGNIATNILTATTINAPQANITSNVLISNIADILGNANVGGVLQVSGNIEALNSRLRIGNILTTGDISTQGQGNVVAVNVTGVGNVSAVGNVTGTYILGNGAFLTGIAGTYSNAQVANFLPTYTGAMTSMAGNLTTTANVSGAYILGNGSALTAITGAAVTGTVANATYATSAGSAGTATTATTAGTVTTNAQPNITSVGILSSLSVTGNVQGGNVRSQHFDAVDSAGGSARNSSGTAQISWGAGGGNNVTFGVPVTMSPANSQVQISPPGTGHVDIAPGSTGSINNMVIGNVTPAAVNATTVSASGNITGNYFIGNGSQLTGLPSGYSNADVATYLASGSLTSNIVTTGVISSYGLVMDFGNISGNLAVTQISGATVSAAGNVTGGNINTAGAVTAASVSATGNVTANGVVVGNSIVSDTTIASRFIISPGNAVVGNLQINNITDGANGIQQVPNNSSLTSNISGAQPGRIVFGSGYDGNLIQTGISTELSTSTRLVTLDKITLPQTQTNPARVAGMAGQLSVDVAGSTWTNKRASGYRFDLQLGNGTINTANYNNIRAAAYNIQIGNSSPSNIGNATVLTVSGVTSGQQVGENSRIGNAISFISVGAIPSGASNVTANTQIGYGVMQSWSGGAATAPGNIIGFYFNGTTNKYGLPGTGNTTRQATNYYAFVNDDPIAQMQLGSIRSAHTYTNILVSQSGNITIDKANGQTQQLGMAANVTITGYANMVTTVSDGVNTKSQTDVLTILVPPTGSTLTLPTGADYKYLSGNSTVPNSGTNWVRITVTATNNAGTPVYLTEIDDYT